MSAPLMPTKRKIEVNPLPGDVNITELWEKYGSVPSRRPSAFLSIQAGMDAKVDAAASLNYARREVYKGNPEIPYNERYRADTYAHPVVAKAYEEYLASKGEPIEEPAGPLFEKKKNDRTWEDSEWGMLGRQDGNPDAIKTPSEVAADGPQGGSPVASIREVARQIESFGVPMDRAFGPGFHLSGLSSMLRAAAMAIDLIANLDKRMDDLGRDFRGAVADWQKVNDSNISHLAKRADGIQDGVSAACRRLDELEKKLEGSSAKPVEVKAVEKAIDQALARWTVERTREWAFIQTLVPWALDHGISLSVGEAIREGKVLSEYCRRSGFKITEYFDPRGFNVKVYPEEALQVWFLDYHKRNPDRIKPKNLGFCTAETKGKFVPQEWMMQTVPGEWIPREEFRENIRSLGIDPDALRLPKYLKPVPKLQP